MSSPNTPSTYCPKCGAKNEITSLYCASCGQKLIVTPADGQYTAGFSGISGISGADISATLNSALQTVKETIAKIPFGEIPKMVKRIPKAALVAACAAVALVAVFIVLYAVGKSVTNPIKIAEEYFVALSSGEYDKAYELINLNESDFVNKEYFARHMEQSGVKIDDLLSYTITEKKASAAGINTSRDEWDFWFFGDMFDDIAEPAGSSKDSKDSDDDDLIKIYTVKYTVKGVASERSADITLLKNNEKRLLFFNDYDVVEDSLLVSNITFNVPVQSAVLIDGIGLSNPKEAVSNYSGETIHQFRIPAMFAGTYDFTVKTDFSKDYTESITINRSGFELSVDVRNLEINENLLSNLYFDNSYNIALENILLSDVTVTVPIGAAVTVNGIELKNPEQVETGGGWFSSDMNMDCYTIHKMFAGEHTLTVKTEFCDDYTTEFRARYNNDGVMVYLSDLTLKTEITEELAVRTERDYTAIMNGALKGTGFNALGISVTGDAAASQFITDIYNDLVSTVMINEIGTGYKEITFNEFTNNSRQTQPNYDMTYVCNMKVNYNFTRIDNTAWRGDPNLVERSYSNRNADIQFIYVMEDGTWVLQSMSLGRW